MPSNVMQPLPVRTRLTVLRDAPAKLACIVFCERERSTVPLARCAMCRHGGDIARDRDARVLSVECTEYTLRSTPPPSESGHVLETVVHAGVVAQSVAELPVGIVLTRAFLCVEYDVPFRTAARLLDAEPNALGLAVVDSDARFVGLLPRASVALALADSNDAVGVAGHMAYATWCIREDTSLHDAFEVMASRHAREVTVVDAERRVVGTLRDVDALRFVAYVSRTGLRPDVERAA